MATSTEEARRKVIAAREALGGELDEFTSAARSAADIPAKIKKNPLQTTALAAGAGFLIVGGPKRVLKAAAARVLPPRKRRPHEGLLPKQIDKVVKKDAGPFAADIEGALEEDFAHYLKQKGAALKDEPSPAKSFWKTYDALVAPLGVIVAKQLGDRLVAADPNRPSAGQPGGPPAAEAEAAAGGRKPSRGGRLPGLSNLPRLGGSIRSRTSTDSRPEGPAP